jgi:hypothetical protein
MCLYTHLRSSNVRHLGMAEATRLKKRDVEVTLVAPAYQMSRKSKDRFKSYY